MKRGIVLFLGISILLFPFLTNASNKKARFCFSPLKRKIALGSEFKVEVFFKNKTPKANINVVQGKINFSKNLLDVRSASPDKNILNFWLRNLKGYKVKNGKMKFTGVIFNPGFSKKKGRLFIVTFYAKKAGKAKVLVKNRMILLNDGLATKLPTKTCKAKYTIVPETGTPSSN